MLQFLRRPSYRHLNTIAVSAAALRHNHTVLSTISPAVRIAPVLKSNAYGHGLRLTAPLFDQLAAPFLVVDSLFEAYELLKLRVHTPVLILGYTHPVNFQRKRLPFHFTVFDRETPQILAHHQPGASVHIFVDTGMHREGVPLSDLRPFLREVKRLDLRIVGLASHLADADTLASPAATRQQIVVYRTALQMMLDEGISPIWRHVSASAGHLRNLETPCNLIRAGIASYGLSPLPKSSRTTISLQPALRFFSTIAQLKTIAPSAAVGYNGTFVAKRTMRLALLPAGYYEGIDRRLSNTGVVRVRGQICPIVGRVSMNMTSIDVTRVSSVAVGDEVEVFGHDLTAPNCIVAAARVAHTIPYDLLVGLAESVHRTVVPHFP